MGTFLENIYPWAHKKSCTEVLATNTELEWEQLTDQFDARFQLGRGGVIGETHSNGFKFKLNFLNYYPIVPTVIVEQKKSLIKVRQFYERSAKWAQIYWLTIFTTIVLIVPLGMIREVLNPKFETNLEEMLIVLFFECLFLVILCLFSFKRNRLWKDSATKAHELIDFIQTDQTLL